MARGLKDVNAAIRDFAHNLEPSVDRVNALKTVRSGSRGKPRTVQLRLVSGGAEKAADGEPIPALEEDDIAEDTDSPEKNQ